MAIIPAKVEFIEAPTMTSRKKAGGKVLMENANGLKDGKDGDETEPAREDGWLQSV